MQESEETKVDDLLIPTWFKISVAVCAVDQWYLLICALGASARPYYGFPYLAILFFLIGLALISSAITVMVWGFSQSRLGTILYWLFQYLREGIVLVAAYILLQLIMLKMPLLNNRGSPLYLNTILLATMAIFVKPLAKGQKGIFFKRSDRILRFEENLGAKTRKIPVQVLSILVAVLPILITYAIIRWGFGAKLSDFRPYYWNDQTSYWIWVRSFSKYGFNVGYNVGNEMPAPAAFNHYGEGSPLYVFLYGFIAKLVGWSPQLLILINFCLLAIVIYWFTRSLKFTPTQTIWTGLVAIFFWPVLLYLPTGSQETLNQVIGFVLTGIFFVLLFKGRETKPFVKALFVAFLIFASLVRLSWALLFYPLIFLCPEGKFKKFVLSIIFGSILLVSSISVTKYLVPPFGNSIFSTLEQTLKAGPQIFLDHFISQFRNLLTDKGYYPSLIVVSELLIIIGWSLLRVWNRRNGALTSKTTILPLAIFDIYNLLSTLVGGMFLYLVGGFFRVFIPPLLVSVLLHIVQKDFKPVLVLLGINILFLAPLLAPYSKWQGNFRPNLPQVTQSQDIINANVVYDNNTNNPWCNTLLLPLDNYDYRVTIIPPGIGVSHLSSIHPLATYPLKSKYLLFDQDSYQKIQDKLNVELLASLPIGDLYYNLDSGCRK